MNNGFQTIRITDIPIDIIEEVSKQISHYLVGIVKIQETSASEDAILIGSGTLVKICNTFGILTANHVIKEVPSQGEIGLILSERLHRYTIQSELVGRIEIAKGSIQSEGPDLGFLVLPQADLGQIKAMKSFRDLSIRRQRILDNPPENDSGIWFLCGFPDEQTTNEGATKGFEIVKGFHGLCGGGGVTKEYMSANYDYLEFDVLYTEEGQAPESFGGVSGGGLWQVPLRQKVGGKIEAKETILSGVAFYQSPVENNVRSIKCHGRQSIYKIAYDFVAECS